MNEVEKVTKDAIASGGVLAILYFDVHAKTKEIVQELGTGFVNDMIHKQGVIYALGEINEPVSGGDGKNFSSSIEIKVLTKNFATLAAICMANSPYSVEILRPDEIKMPLNEAHDLLGTMAATTAEYKTFIITKLAKPEEIANLQYTLGKRAEMGKNLLKKGETK